MSKLASDRVTRIFEDCLFTSDEVAEILDLELDPAEEAASDTPHMLVVAGVAHTVSLHPERTRSYRDEVREMLDELPDDFKQSGGGGMSFLNMCMDRHGDQWTDLHQVQERLAVLGIALGLARWLLPRGLWAALPGRMPYLVVLDKEAE